MATKIAEFIEPKEFFEQRFRKDFARRILFPMRKRIEKYYDAAFSTWEPENRPVFDVYIGMENDSYILRMDTEDTPFVWVDLGTEGHFIEARNAPMLKFKVGGMPKTMPGRIVSRKGMPGTQWKSKFRVWHPGIEARNISENIARALDKEFQARLNTFLANYDYFT